ncbi:MAG: hypothetical protein KJ893_04655 [Candidatus Omnitrophica bacterium]|nr:hypothetical protein [Candidatus Omnitrophota bacterium]MBU4477783.1 hypothetical protein [Candidatus Omnitrophota bacterium]MCG2703628.1 hypothetical protein [Candidatus Omnitrophota bacterium]
MERRKYQQIEKEQWQRHIERQARSGESIVKYCKTAGLKESGFYRWRRLLKKSGGAGFVRVDESRAQAGLIITTPNGYRVEALSVELGIAAAQKLTRC